MNTEKLTWYVARSGGIVAWCLLALALIWGLLLSSRLLGRKSSPAWLLAVHRHIGGLSVIFTVIHVAAIMLDDFVDFGFREVLVPWASEWRPGPVAWGIIGAYLLVAIEATSLAMRWLPKKLWRGIHWMSAGLFVVATVHGWQSGTDTGRAFMVAIIATIVGLTVLTGYRIVNARRQPVISPDRAAMLAALRERKTADEAPLSPALTVEPVTSAEIPVAAPEPVAVDLELPDPVRAVRSLPANGAGVAAPVVSAFEPAPAAVAVAERPLGDMAAFGAFGSDIADIADDTEEAVVDVDDLTHREAGPVGSVWKRRA